MRNIRTVLCTTEFGHNYDITDADPGKGNLKKVCFWFLLN